VEILGIAFVKGDKKGRRWLADYAKDREITWTLVPSSREWYGPPFEAYDVHFIPFNILLDAQGKVVTTMLSGSRIEEEIARVLERGPTNDGAR
jgi:hypothetical protein